MEVVNDNTQPIWNDATTLNIRPPDRTRGWYLPPGRMGTFGLRFHGDEPTLAQLASLLLFIEQWGSLGAKSQLGYGAFRIQNREELQRLARWNIRHSSPSTEQPNLPNAQYFGFFRYTIRETSPTWWAKLPGFERVLRQIRPLVERYQTIPLTPVLRNAWRYTYWKPEWGSASSFWGTLERDRIRSKVLVSRDRIRSKVLVSWAYPADGAWHIHGSAWLQSLKASQPAWAMLADNEQWNQILGVTGQLEVFPHQTWQPWTPHAVRVFLGQ
jgi:CRISPR-associated protein Cmr1